MNDQLDLTQARHAHWWKLEEANGPTSGGVCKVCGALSPKQWRNWFDEEPPKFGQARVRGGKK